MPGKTPNADRKRAAAYKALQKAIRDGRVTPLDHCEKCGAKEGTILHEGQAPVKITSAHYNYEEPLKVRWLCRICHSAWDHRRQYGPVTDDPLAEFLGFIEKREKAEELTRAHVGGAVRYARLATGVSQSFLATNLGVTQSYVSQVESGIKSVSSAQLRNIHTALSSAEGDSDGTAL